jgi:hypothetical protein
LCKCDQRNFGKNWQSILIRLCCCWLFC